MSAKTELLREVMLLAWKMAEGDRLSARAPSVRRFFAEALKRAWATVKMMRANRAARAAAAAATDTLETRRAILILECKDRLSFADMQELASLRAQLMAA